MNLTEGFLFSALTEGGAAWQPSLNLPVGLQPRQVRLNKRTRRALSSCWFSLTPPSSCVRRQSLTNFACLLTKKLLYSSCRTLMASTHVNHNIYITEVKTGKCLHSLVGHRRTPWCVTFHPTIPGLVASGCLDGEVRIWDLHVSTQKFWMFVFRLISPPYTRTVFYFKQRVVKIPFNKNNQD